MNSFELATETTVEQVPYLEKISNFNTAEKIANLKELAICGIDKVKSIFQRINIKEALQSLLQKNSDTITPSDTSEAIENTTDTNQEKVLTELDASSTTYLQAQILEYYRKDAHMTEVVQKKLSDRGIPQDQLSEKTLYLLGSFAKGSVEKFEDTIAQQLEDYGLNKDEVENYWQWRVQHTANTPTKASFVRTNNGDRIINDDFVTAKYIAQYRATQVSSSINEEFFRDLQTTEDIEARITQALKEFAPKNIGESPKGQKSD